MAMCISENICVQALILLAFVPRQDSKAGGQPGLLGCSCLSSGHIHCYLLPSFFWSSQELSQKSTNSLPPTVSTFWNNLKYFREKEIYSGAVH